MKRSSRLLSIFIILTLLELVVVDSALAARRALLIGISKYDNIRPLENPPFDVMIVREKLATAGYDVTTILDPDTKRADLVTAFGKFARTVRPGDEVVVYYSGHGIDVSGANMLIPADSPGSEDIDRSDLEQLLIPIRPQMVRIEDHQPLVQIWIIDACREDPYAQGGRPFATHGGLAALGAPNSFVFFSAAYSQVAQDKLSSDPPNAGRGSPFSRTFAALFDKWKDKYISLYATELRQEVSRLVEPHQQTPAYEANIGQWCFVDCASDNLHPGVGTMSTGQLEALVQARTKPFEDLADTQKSLIAALQQQLQLNQAQVVAFLKVAGEADVPPDGIAQALSEFAARYKELLAQVAAAPSSDPAIVTLKADARKALEDGDLDRADAILADVQAIQDRAAAQQARQAVTTRAERAAIARANLQYPKAAALFAEAASRLPAGENEERLGYLVEEADVLYRQGDEFGDNRALELAADRYRALLRLHAHEARSPQVIPIQSQLAKVYGILGTRQDNIDLLEEAVTAQREVSDLVKSTSDLQQYTDVQVNLARTLQDLAGRITDLSNLEEAIDILRTTLAIVEKEDAKHARLKIQLELSEALRNFGWRLQELRQRSQGLEYIRESLQIARTANEAIVDSYADYTQAEMMVASGKLGDTLGALGYLEENPDLLREAATAYYTAASGSARSQFPREWGELQQRLAITLRTVGWQLRDRGQPEDGNLLLKSALESFERALEVRTRDHWPLEWAATRMEVGQTLSDLGIQGGIRPLEEAVEAYNSVLKERTRHRVTLDWAETQHRLGIALRTLGVRLAETGRQSEGSDRLREALKALKLTLSVRTQNRWPSGWAYLQADIGRASYELGKLDGPGPLQEAVEAYELSLRERSRTEVPVLWADTQAGLGAAFWELGKQNHDVQLRREALNHLELAQSGYREAHVDAKAEGLAPGISALKQEIGAP